MATDTKDRILQSAAQLFWRQSYGTVSVDDICKSAKIHKGSFYHYFSSKTDLVLEVYEAMWAYNRQFMDSAFSPSLSPLERLQNYCDIAYNKQKEIARIHGRVLGCPFMTCGSELCSQDERIRHKVDEIFERNTKYFETLLRDAQAQGLADVSNYATQAHEMLSFVTGVMYQARIKNDAEIIRHELLSGLMRYLQPQATPKERKQRKPQLEKA